MLSNRCQHGPWQQHFSLIVPQWTNFHSINHTLWHSLMYPVKVYWAAVWYIWAIRKTHSQQYPLILTNLCRHLKVSEALQVKSWNSIAAFRRTKTVTLFVKNGRISSWTSIVVERSPWRLVQGLMVNMSGHFGLKCVSNWDHAVSPPSKWAGSSWVVLKASDTRIQVHNLLPWILHGSHNERKRHFYYIILEKGYPKVEFILWTCSIAIITYHKITIYQLRYQLKDFSPRSRLRLLRSL